MNRREFNKKALFCAAGFSSTIFNGCLPGEKRKGSKKTSRPNILFCLADDISYPHMGAYGCDWVKTPAFDSIARNGVLFNNAYTTNAKCAPSRACVLTGRNSWQLDEACNHLAFFPSKFKTYAEVLAKKDYIVGCTGKLWEPGIAGNDEYGRPRNLCGQPFQKRKLTPPTSEISTIDYYENFKDFLDQSPQEKPFCFWYGGFEPHRKYEYQSGIKKAGKKPGEIDDVPEFWPDNRTVRTDMLDYAYEIEHFDSHLQKMLDLLRSRGRLENTVVIVTADNGMPFPRAKGQAYDFSNHLPLAVMWQSGIKKTGRVVDDFVSFIDFAPTFLELAGVRPEDTQLEPVEGKSFTDILYSSKSGTIDPGRDYVLIGKERHDVGRPKDRGYPIRGIVRGDYLYVINFHPSRWPAGNPETGYMNCDGSPTKTVCLDAKESPSMEKYWQMSFGKRPPEEFYNIKVDRDCMNNLAFDETYAEKKNQLKSFMISELRRQKDPRMFGNGEVFEQYDVCWPEYRDFYERYMNGYRPDTSWINESDFRPLQ